MIFEYGSDENKFNYINDINASADHEVYYTTNFSITLPKGIINWIKSNNNFFFEYDNKQIIYIYSAYKNEGKESDNWILSEISSDKARNDLNYYWEKRKYNENYLLKEHSGRISKLYTNGKYKILLYNIKNENLPIFTQATKTFNIIL
jgi:hypothetical protein